MDEIADVPTLNEAAIGLHEMYTSMRSAGFNESEACRIIGSYLANAHQTED